jgi:hypothetical protein
MEGERTGGSCETVIASLFLFVSIWIVGQSMANWTVDWSLFLWAENRERKGQQWVIAYCHYVSQSLVI